MVAILSIISGSIAILLASQHAFAQAPIDPSQIPAGCQSNCKPVTDQLNTCGSDITCLCSNSVVDGLSQCLSCAVGVGMSASTGQSILDQFDSACSSAGHPVKAGTISGSSPSSGSTGPSTTSDSSPVSASGSTGPSTASDSSPVSASGNTGPSTASNSSPASASSSSPSPSSTSGGGLTGKNSSGATLIVANAGALGFALGALGAGLLLA